MTARSRTPRRPPRAVEDLLTRLAAAGDPAAAEAAEELVRAADGLLRRRPRPDRRAASGRSGNPLGAARSTTRYRRPAGPARPAPRGHAWPGSTAPCAPPTPPPDEAAAYDADTGTLRLRPTAGGGCGCAGTASATRERVEGALSCFAPEVTTVEFETPPAGRGRTRPAADRVRPPGAGAWPPGSDRAAPATGLRRFLAPAPPTAERCELCAVPVDDRHRHLVDTERRALACACTGCAMLFDRQGAGGGRFRTIPDRYLATRACGRRRRLAGPGIPVGIAFLFRNSAQDRLVALYPSPAGATESEIAPATWRRLRPLAPRRAAGARHRGAPGAAHPRPHHLLPGADRRGLRTRRPAAAALAGLRRRRPRAGRTRRLLRASRSGGADRGRPDGEWTGERARLHLPGVTRRRPRRRTHPRLPAAGAPPATASGSTPSPCAARSASNRRCAATPREAERLGDLFGERSRWGEQLQPMQFAQVSVMVPGFTGETEVDLPVPCTYDMDIATTKYFAALRDGEVPLLLLFSGTAFCGPGGFRCEPVPWDRRRPAACRSPSGGETIEQHFPGCGWLRLPRDTMDELLAFRSRTPCRRGSRRSSAARAARPPADPAAALEATAP